MFGKVQTKRGICDLTHCLKEQKSQSRKQMNWISKSFHFYSYFSQIIPELQNFNPQAVGMNSGVQFSLSNFLEDILQPTSSKMSPTSNLGL